MELHEDNETGYEVIPMLIKWQRLKPKIIIEVN